MLKPEFPLGLCQSGCGKDTLIAPKTDREKGWLIGKPAMFCSGYCAQFWGKQIGRSRMARVYADYYARQDELARDLAEVHGILARIEEADAEGRLCDDVACPRCEFRFARLEMMGPRRLLFRCLDCGKGWDRGAPGARERQAANARRTDNLGRWNEFNAKRGEMRAEKAFQMREAGLTFVEIGLRMGISESGVRFACRRAAALREEVAA